ncbi:unnamed protein product [Paramecium sonneborni]|uniref:Uncharacterized protein n=1 Tax=Paramecium sonneborni TaxID=65129 RepID=A0A8S1RLX4_9CILI|nr:unnamed protein product [Paramecium sonneborni]
MNSHSNKYFGFLLLSKMEEIKNEESIDHKENCNKV